MGIALTVLRFIPYLGIWTAAVFPILLSIVLPEGGHLSRFLLTVTLFIGAEAIVTNFVEPYFYGSRTGVSSIAILMAAVFWTWLWGGVGLLLSTPLTVVLAVMGKYVPQLEFLSIMVSDQPVLPLHERYYQRLLAEDPVAAEDLLQQFLKQGTLVQLYDDLLLPACGWPTRRPPRCHLQPASDITSASDETVHPIVTRAITGTTPKGGNAGCRQ